MAHLYPEELPSSIRDNPRRRAEVRTYDALSLLGGAWWVFYSVPWLTASSPASGRRDGETDFVVAHPQHGFIALEVKGGGISREGGVWFSTDRDGVKHEIKDPFQQAMQGKKVLLGQVKDHRSWPGAFVRSAHAAVFPDLPIVPPLGPHAPPDIAITRSELENIERKLIKIATDSAGADAAPHADGDRLVHVLNELLGKSLFLRVPFATRVADTEQEIVRLTEEQFGVLHMLGFQRRAAIPGCAGSGKTMLAIEKARRLAREGKRTLLVCYNDPLNAHLRASIGSEPGLDVLTFHTLSRLAAEHAGIAPAPVEDDKAVATVLFDAMADVPSLRYDAIIADEGQDIRGDWWAAIEASLVPDGILYVFYDDNQRLYDRSHIPRDLLTFPLVGNVRNTRQIVSVLRKYHSDGAALRARGPVGSSVELVAASPDQVVPELRRVLNRLISVEMVERASIAVLTARGRDRLAAIQAGLKGIPTRLSEDPLSSAVLLETVRRFKGLESPVVIIVDVTEETAGELKYVAYSRARSHLIVIGDEGALPGGQSA